MKRISIGPFLMFWLLMVGCSHTKNITTTDDGKIEAVFVQINDVYEIAPVSGGKEGGMARVATVKKNFAGSNPNTFLVMAGDFVSPSVYNSLKYNNKRIRGAQMIECMNAAGMDIAVFGNHEFDITEAELQERINESAFSWVSSNTFHKTAAGTVPFERNGTPFPEYKIVAITDKDGTKARIGFIAVTINSNKADYVVYTDPFAAARKTYDQIKDSVDAVVAITHQSEADDIALAKQLPGLAAIMGGHEHSGIYDEVGNVKITKAQSNARTAYIVKLNIDKNRKVISTNATVLNIDEKIAIDSSANVVVQKWKKIAQDNYASIGFDPAKVVMTTGEPLDGRESTIRTGSTSLTRLICRAMAFACPKADVVMYNSGSIRLDDILTPPITQYDIIRSLPFGGGIREADMKGSLLLQVLQASAANRNSGGFLQYQPVVASNGTYLLNGQPINPDKVYRVAITDFLFSGKETNLAFLNETNSAITQVYPAQTAVTNPQSDIRLAIIQYLESGGK